MGSLIDILKQNFAETILDVSGTPYNVYSVIVTSDTDLTEFAGILEDVLPEHFPAEDYISIYLSKEGESKEILVELNIPSTELFSMGLFIAGKQQIVTIVDEPGTRETFAVIDENGNSFGAIWFENEWECFEEILKPYVEIIGKAIDNRL